MRCHGEQSGRWTYRLILELAIWPDIKYGEVGFYLAQVLLGYGCFNAYLNCFEKRDNESCRYCGFPVDDTEYILFVCVRGCVARKAASRAVSAELTSDTMVPLMLQSESV